MLLTRKPVGIFVILLELKTLEEKNCEWAVNWIAKNKNTITYKSVRAMLLARKSDGIFVIWLFSKLLKENNLEWAGNWIEHNETQLLTTRSRRCCLRGSRLEYLWSCCWLSSYKKIIANELEIEMKKIKSQLLTKSPRRCCWRGSLTEYLWSCCRLSSYKKIIANELEIELNIIKS